MLERTILQILEEYYELFKCMGDGTASKKEYITSNVFQLRTYNGALDEYYCDLIMSILRLVDTNQVSDYVHSSSFNNYTYTTVINLGRVIEFLTWGSSIRNSWFETDMQDYTLDIDNIRIKNAKELYDAVVEFLS